MRGKQFDIFELIRFGYCHNIWFLFLEWLYPSAHCM